MRNRKLCLAFHAWGRQNFLENLNLWLLLPARQYLEVKKIWLYLCFPVITVNGFTVHYWKVQSRHMFYIAHLWNSFFGYSFSSHGIRIPMHCYSRLHDNYDYPTGPKIASEFLSLVVGFPYSHPTSSWSIVSDHHFSPYLSFCRCFLQFCKCISPISCS